MLRASLVVDAATEAEVRFHLMPSGRPLAAVTIEGLTIQSAEVDPSGYYAEGLPAGGPEVLAQFLERLAARVRLDAAASVQ
jgi:hypothetical protein